MSVDNFSEQLSNEMHAGMDSMACSRYVTIYHLFFRTFVYTIQKIQRDID